MQRQQWKALAPYLAPYFDGAIHDHAKRFWVAENGFANGASFDTFEEAIEDVRTRKVSGRQYQVYDGQLREWVWASNN